MYIYCYMCKNYIMNTLLISTNHNLVNYDFTILQRQIEENNLCILVVVKICVFDIDTINVKM